MRTTLVIGHIGPNGAKANIRIISVVMFCRKCLAQRLFVNLRPWPGEAFQLCECGKCGNSQAHYPTQPAA